jgi:hypothetical protein
MLSRLNPTSGSFTGVCPDEDHDAPLMGQLIYTPGKRSARITFLLPADDLDRPALNNLLESLAVQAGEWGAYHLLAEVDETSPALEPMRHSGFNIYAWQTIWQFSSPKEEHYKGIWQPSTSIDEIAIRNLYQSLVPPLVQGAEPYPEHNSERLVYREDDEIVAYTDAVYGPEGIYLLPTIHPGVKDLVAVLASLVSQQPSIPARPVYVVARSYQAWLESSLQRLDGAVAPRQALMVKHLVIPLRALKMARRSVVGKYVPEATVPLVQHSTINKN